MTSKKSIAVIWDLDGTLIDSYPSIVSALFQLYGEIGTPLTKEAIYHEIITTNAGALIARMEKETGILFSDWAARYSQIRDGKTDQILAMEHAEEALRSLQNKGIAHYIFTHRGHSTFAILDRLGLRSFFQDIITKENGFPRKPSPEAIRYLIDKYQLDPATTYYVGDRVLDMDCAFNAGIQGVMFIPPQSIAAPSGKESFLIHDLLDLEKIL